MSKTEDQKSRYWFAEIFPESAPENFRELLELNGVPFALSPLHDKDRFTDEDLTELIEEGKAQYGQMSKGEFKKPHYHVIYAYPNNTTKKAVQKIQQTINSPIYVIAISNPIKAYEYLSHKNHPEKYQYSDDDIECFNGFDVSLYKPELTDKQRRHYLILCMDKIDELQIVRYKDLMDLIRQTGDGDWFDVASQNTFYLTQIIRDMWHKLEEAKKIELEQEKQRLHKNMLAQVKAERLKDQEKDKAVKESRKSEINDLLSELGVSSQN